MEGNLALHWPQLSADPFLAGNQLEYGEILKFGATETQSHFFLFVFLSFCLSFFFSFFLSFFFLFFFFLRPHLQPMEVPRLGVKSEL